MNKSNDKTIERIRKLLAMAEDASSPNEAMIAARRARSLMDKHQIDRGTVEQQSEKSGFGEQSTNGTRRMAGWVKIVAVAVAKMNDCAIVITGRRGGEKYIKFMGFESDVILAKHTYDYLLETAHRLSKQLSGSGRSSINAYKLGFAREISNRAGEIVKERTEQVRTATGTSMVLAKQDLVKQHFNMGQYRTTAVKTSYRDSTAYAAGRRDGAKVGLDRPIENNQATAPALT